MKEIKCAELDPSGTSTCPYVAHGETAKELKDQIVITPEDVATYYEQNYKDPRQDSDISKDSNDINEAIVEILRRKKVEDAYDPWLRELKSQYKIEINSAQWENISGTKNISAKNLKIGTPNDHGSP